MLVASMLSGSAMSQSLVITGSSSSQTPYVTPTAGLKWTATSILTTGDLVGTYRMAGTPDGLGAYDNGDGTFTLLANHEFSVTAGTSSLLHAGTLGAFVSKFVIDKSTLQVISGSDFLASSGSLYLWSGTSASGSWSAGTARPFDRLCSADLAFNLRIDASTNRLVSSGTSAFYNSASSKGYEGLIFLNGEESSSSGKGYAWIASGFDAGKVYELPHLGKFSIENLVVNPFETGDTTWVAGTDDSTPGQVYIYQGFKLSGGSYNAVELAGLANGTLYGVKVNNGGSNYSNGPVTREYNGAISGTFTLTPAIDSGTVALKTYSQIQSAGTSSSVGLTEFARPEDSAWLRQGTLLFATTGGAVSATYTPGATTYDQTSKIYKLAFTDSTNLVLGGSISVLLDSANLRGKDGQTARKFDNITVGLDNLLYIQEDPGDVSYIAKHWVVDPFAANPTSTALQIMESDRTRFETGGVDFRTIDEEHSGIIDVTDILGRGDGRTYLLMATQNHAVVTGTQTIYGLIEGGQFVLLSGTVQAGSFSTAGLGSGTYALNGTSLYIGGGTQITNPIILSGVGAELSQIGSSGTIASAISGSGQLAKTGGGTLTLSGNNTYTGNTNIFEGALVLNGSVSSPAVVVYDGATLKGSGKINGSLTNRGTFAPGNSPGITTITGNYVNAGTLQIEVGGITAGSLNAGYDQVLVSGTFTAGGTLQVVNYNSFNPARAQTFQAVQATTYSGTFEVLDRRTQTTQVFYSHNNGTMYGTGITETQTFEAYGDNANRQAIGKALYNDGLTSASVIISGSSSPTTAKAYIPSTDLGDAVKTLLTAGDAGLALDGLSPESYSSLSEYTNRSASALSNALVSIPLGHEGLNAQTGFLWNQAGSTSSSTSLDSKYQAHSSFLVVGYGLSSSTSVNLIGSIEGGNVSASNLSGSTDGNGIGLGFVTELFGGTLGLGLGHVRHDATVTRSGQTADVDEIKGTSVALQYSFPVSSKLTPFIGLRYTSAKVNPFTESGSGANLDVSQFKQKRSVAEIGLTYNQDLSSWIDVSVGAGYEQTLGNDRTQITSRFADAGTTATPFTVESKYYGKNAFKAGAGIQFKFGNYGSLSTGYEMSAGSNLESAHSFKAVYSVGF